MQLLFHFKHMIPFAYCLVLLFAFLVTPLHYPELCDRAAHFKANSILLPQQALNAGAKFLKSVPVDSLRSCYFSCCELPSCTAAIFKSKLPHECFLFNCGRTNSCTYTHHDYYDVVTLSSKTVAQTAALHEPCDETLACANNHTVCSHGFCVCQPGWVKQGMECVRSLCGSPSLQFQCRDGSTCVAIYDRCNGIIECPDGSDELDCTSDRTTPKSQSNTSRAASNVTETPASTEKHQDNVIEDALANLEELSSMRNRPLRKAMDSAYSGNEAPSYTSRQRKEVFPSTFTPLLSRSRDDLSNTRSRGFRRLNQGLHEKPYSSSSDELDWQENPATYFEPDSELYSPQLPEETEQLHENFGHSRVPMRRSRFEPEFTEFPSWRSHRSESFLGHADPEPEPTGFYFDEYPTRRKYRPHHYFRGDSIPDDELVDPSVLDGLSVGESEHSRRRILHDRFNKAKHRTNRERLAGFSPNHQKSVNHENDVPTPQSTAAPPNSNQGSIPNSPDLATFKHTETASHTAALILAFSLGLVCCFIGLLIVEWRRRRRLRHWANNRRISGAPVLFGENGKLPNVRHRNQRRHKHLFGNMGTAFSPEEESKALCEGLVL